MSGHAKDRWEEDAGYSIHFGADISALLAAADIADLTDTRPGPEMRETADAWNDNIER